MSLTLPAGIAQQALGIITDGLAAYQAGFADKAKDEQVVIDGLGLAASFGVPFAGEIVGFLPLIQFVIDNNQSIQPGALPRIASGARGGAAQAEQQPQEDDGA